MDWKSEQPTRVHLINLNSGEVTTKVQTRVPEDAGPRPGLPSWSSCAPPRPVSNTPLCLHLFISRRSQSIQLLMTSWRCPLQFAPSFFAFHYLNAFESDDGETVFLDIAKFKTPKVARACRLALIAGMFRIRLCGPLYAVPLG